MKLVLIMCILTFLSLPAVVNAQNLTLDANFHTISVIAPFTTTPSSVTAEYKKNTDSAWRSYDSRLVYIDTRANWLQNTARFKIFGLSPNTLYDVRVTFAGSDTLTGQIRTLDTNPPAPSLRTVYVDPVNGNDANNGLSPSTAKRTVQGAFNIAQAGDRIWLKPSTYTLTSRALLSADGTANNWIRLTKWEGEPGDVIIEGNGIIGPIITIDASYVRIDSLTIRKSTLAVLDITGYPSGTESWRWIDNNKITDWNINNIGAGNNYAGISSSNNPERTIIVGNYLKRRDVVSGNQSGPGYAIHTKNENIEAGGRAIVWNNTIIGGRDGISAEAEGNVRGGWYRNADIYENDISYVDDNAISLDGASVNTAAFDNVVHTAFNLASMVPVSIGPAYLIRNTGYDIRDMGGPYPNPSRIGYKVGGGSGAWYMLHESTYLKPGIPVPGNVVGQEGYGIDNFKIFNSALMGDRWVFEFGARIPGTGFVQTNYNVLYSSDSTKLVDWFGGATYATLTEYQQGTGNEANGWTSNLATNDWTDPDNGDFTPKTNSILINAGSVINGVNNDVEDSSWNYKGSAPDIGAVEYDSGAPPTFGFSISANPSSGSIVQGSSTTTTVTATLTSGSTQSVSFSASGLPTGASPSFSPTSCNPTCSSTLTITTSSTTPAGNYPITITGTGGSLVRTASYSLTVSSTDTTKPRWSNNQTNSTLAGVFVNHSVVLTDETALDYYIFEFDNGTGARSNISTVDISGTQVTANRVVLTNSTVGSTIRWRYYFNDTGNNWNSTDLFSYRTASAADTTPPTRNNGQPSGILAAGTNQANINLTTNEAATCRYSNTAGIAYGSMTNAFSTTGSTIHSRLMTGLTNGSSYRYYVRCNDTAGNANIDDYNISFSVGLSGENCIDNDSDNYYSPVNCTGGNDCNDNNNAINPSAAEVCGNGIDENCDGVDGACPQPPSPPPSGGGGGGIVPINPPVETPITKEIENKTAVNVTPTTGTVSLEITTPIKVESGELFNVTVWLLSPVKTTYTLTVGDVQQQVELEAGKEEMLIIPVRAPEARGSYTLTAEIGETVRAKDIDLDYLPLFLYVSETRVGNETLVNITVKNYESMSTELRVIKNGRSDAFFELIEGKKEYNRQLKLTQAGEYKIIATASSEGKIIDTDEYLLTVGGEKRFDYRLLMIIVFAFVVAMITLLSLIR